MRKFLVIVLASLAGAALADEPDAAFENLVDAVYEGDAQCVHECLSTESIALLDMMLAMVKMQPNDAAVQISQELGADITPEELMDWTSIDIVEVLISSPGFAEALPPREDITVDGFQTEGDSSIIFVKIEGLDEPFEVSMIRDGEDWKLDQSFIQSEL